MRKKALLIIPIVVILLIIILYFQKKEIPYSFYYWQQTYHITTPKTPKYIKVLDIAYDGRAVIHKTLFKSYPKNEITPVIYLDNPVLKYKNAYPLAKEVSQLLKEFPLKYHEIQIDCDWTNRTQKAYFNFLKELKKLTQKKLSATIRLHQVKYFKRTLVPPVDRGVLMYYNMSNFKDLKTKNYILDLDVAQKYHYNFQNYPLKLDLALPLYAQAALIRFEEVIGAIEGVRVKDLNKNFEHLNNNFYRVKKTHYFNGRLLYRDDILRLDAVTVKDLKYAIKNLKEVMKQPDEIIFYRWGNRDFYKEEDLKELTYW